jgi:FKBP-type peptidyl-prolyl cis-trans isomerase
MKKKKIFALATSAIFLILILIALYFSFFRSNRVFVPQDEIKEESSEGKLERVNKFLIEKDQERIQSFIDRRNWDMQRTESGLWYSVYSEGTGRKVSYGDYVKLKHEIRLLDGTLLYASDSTGLKTVHVGRDEEIKGLHEGLQLLSEGAEARFIIPPHLAYGLVGDGERIPARAILYYDLEVVNVTNQ